MIGQMLENIREIYEIEFPREMESFYIIKPSNKEEIENLETETGEILPADYKEFLKECNLRIYFEGNYEFSSAKKVMSSWKIMKEQLENGKFDDGRMEFHRSGNFGNWKDEIIQEAWWSIKWIPFAEDSGGNMMCIDCAPGRNGRKHQVVSMEVQEGQGPFATEYKSFAEYLQRHVELLNEGKYKVEDWGLEINATHKC